MFKKMLLSLALLSVSGVAVANSTDYYTNPNHPGRHYDCAKPGTIVQYENDRVMYLCGGIEEVLEKRFPRETIAHWKVVDPSKLLVKTNIGENFDQEQIDKMSLDPLTEPFYDSAEKRMVRWKGIALGADLITTAAGVSIGNCSEAGPLKHVPVLGLAIGVFDFASTRARSKRTPRYYTVSKFKLNWAPTATHGAAAVNNLVKCIL